MGNDNQEETGSAFIAFKEITSNKIIVCCVLLYSILVAGYLAKDAYEFLKCF